MEIRFVQTFRSHGVSLQSIRRALARAKELWEDDEYPFLSLKFKSDGKAIFAAAAKNRDEEEIVFNVLTGQLFEERFLQRPLYEGLEYDHFDKLRRWWPLGLDRSIVLDPKRRFGQPITKEEGVPTKVLAAAFIADRSRHAVADWYQVGVQAVDDAVEFEQLLAA